MRKKDKKANIELYRSDLIYVESIEKLAKEHCPIIPLHWPSNGKSNEDDLILTVRSAAENKGFIMGYEHAISVVKHLYLNAINDCEEEVLKNVFNKLVDCSY